MRPRAEHSLPLSAELKELAREFEVRAVTLGEIVDTLGERATGLMLVVLSLPFVVPVPLPGLSIIFGLAIMVLAIGFIRGRRPWFPQWMRRRAMPPKFFPRLLGATGKLVGWIERRLRPRQLWILSTTARIRFHAVSVVVAAILLTLPIPPIAPLTNTLPALAIIVLTMSIIESDGVGVLVSHFILFGTLIYFALIPVFYWAAIVEFLDKFDLWKPSG